MVDLRSDTVSQPTQGMKEAMMEAPLGDDVLGDDPTVKRLEAMAAEMSGKEAALFVPSGTMANQIAIATHTRPGDEVLMYDGAHPFHYEAAGAAVLSGVQIRPLPADNGVLELNTVVAAIRPVDDHFAPATLLCVEDTSNRGGGTVYPLDRLNQLAEFAHSRGLKTHLDGARVFNAVVASGQTLAERVTGFDTVSFCLSKGLGCPVGSLLCGETAIMQRARRLRKLMGGGMRQSGILAAAGIYAFEHHIQRLEDDHRRCRSLAMGLLLDGMDVKLPETNILYVDMAAAPVMQERLEALGVRALAVGPERMRFVTHLGVGDEGISKALAAFKTIRKSH